VEPLAMLAEVARELEERRLEDGTLDFGEEAWSPYLSAMLETLLFLISKIKRATQMIYLESVSL